MPFGEESKRFLWNKIISSNHKLIRLLGIKDMHEVVLAVDRSASGAKDVH